MTTIIPQAFWTAVRKEAEDYHFLEDLAVQPKWDVPEVMAINVAISGRATADNKTSEFPQSIDEYIKAAGEVIEAGATGIHVDFSLVVDREGRRLDKGEVPILESYKMVLEPLRARFGRGFVANLNVLNGDTFDDCVAPAREGLADVAPCAAGHPDAFMVPAITALEKFGVKPEIVIHSSGEIELAKRKIIDAGIARKPYNWIILYGLPFDSGRTLLSGTWVPNAKDMIQHLILMVDQIRSIDPDGVITVCAAGRATLYLTTVATMLGIHIRVGTEDTVWRYPNSDEMFASNLDMFLRAKTIAELLGRRVATADEYRAMLKPAT